jgi:hypothetical protein
VTTLPKAKLLVDCDGREIIPARLHLASVIASDSDSRKFLSYDTFSVYCLDLADALIEAHLRSSEDGA